MGATPPGRHQQLPNSGSRGREGHFSLSQPGPKRTLVMTLEAGEFIRRFLQHVLPAGFYKIRYYGIMASINLKTRMEDALSMLPGAVWLSRLEGLNTQEMLRIITGKDPHLCPVCQKGRMVRGRKNPLTDNRLTPNVLLLKEPRVKTFQTVNRRIIPHSYRLKARIMHLKEKIAFFQTFISPKKQKVKRR